MATAQLKDPTGADKGTVDLPAEIFESKINRHVMWQAVVNYQQNQRQGTVETKTRATVSGGGVKPWRQKGTGRARSGSLRSPVWRHGGSVFGPKPRSYAIDIPRKKYRAALQSALSAKVAEDSIVIVSDLALTQPKTKSLAKMLIQLGVAGSALLVVGAGRADIIQAARNLSNVKVVHPEQLNVYDIMRVRSLVIPERELERVKEVWS